VVASLHQSIAIRSKQKEFFINLFKKVEQINNCFKAFYSNIKFGFRRIHSVANGSLSLQHLHK